jgi:recombinational DNA repair protein RecR
LAGGGSYPEPVERLVECLQRMPGIGKRTATRLAFHLLKAPSEETESLAAALSDVQAILGLSPTLEGDTTAHFLTEALATRPVRITRLARGLPSGSALEFATPAMLADALLGRAASPRP